MKRVVLLSWFSSLIAISVLHVALNVGWSRFVSGIRETFGLERKQLYVGYLPVT